MTAHIAGDEEFPTWLNNFIFSLLIFFLSPSLFLNPPFIFHMSFFIFLLFSEPLLALFLPSLCSLSVSLLQVPGWKPLHSGSCGALQLQTPNSHVSLAHLSSQTLHIYTQILIHKWQGQDFCTLKHTLIMRIVTWLPVLLAPFALLKTETNWLVFCESSVLYHFCDDLQ